MGCVALLLAACAPEATAVPPPTQTLIPSTATPVPTLRTPTHTPTPLPAPADILPTATPRIWQPLVPAETRLDTDLTQRIVSDLATMLALDEEAVQVGQVETWYSANFDIRLGGACGSPPLRLVQAIPGFRYTLLVGRNTHTYVTRGAAQFLRCPQIAVLQGDLLLQADPVAAEMAALAQRQVAQQVDLSTRRITLQEIHPYTWPDTSLGCPLPDVAYDQAAIDGYRLVLAAAGERFIFHTDAVTLYPCPAEREQLPQGAQGER